jgi:anthranilate synthase component I
MYRPSLEEVKKLKTEGNLAPVYREINADMETPVSAYLKIARGSYSFLLESVEGGERLARYSFLGTEPAKIIKTGFKSKETPHLNPLPQGARKQEKGDKDGNFVDPLLLIEQEFKKYKSIQLEGLPRFHGGMVGYLSYEVAGYYEKLPASKNDPLGLPESILMLADTLLIFDHLTHKIKVVSHVRLDGDIEKSYKEATLKIDELVKRLKKPLVEPEKAVTPAAAVSKTTANVTQQEYEGMVLKMKQHIFEGDIFQGLPSLRVSCPTKASPFAIYRALRSINPSPYMYFLHLDDIHIVGASPEMLVRVEDGVISYHPIAGTRPRGKDAAEDKALEAELKTDEKERAEHLMLVDLGRNDVGKISQPGTVTVTQFMETEWYSHVIHMVSNIQGKLRQGLTPYDALRSCFPAGTVSGAPKIRAMEIIAGMEKDKRGPYAGAVGYFDFSGNLDTAITIRTIVIKDGTAYIQAAAGIVADSVPENEYHECLHKMQSSMSAISQAEAS